MTPPHPSAVATRRPRPPRGGNVRGEIYRQSRIWHGYLSAFAFIALIFFSVTGITLNHPEWFTPKAKEPALETSLTLPPETLAAARAAADPARALAEAVGRRTALRGAYRSGEVLDGEALIRLEGVTGSSDVFVDLETGDTEVTVARADLVTTLNELHRGKNAGAAWKWVIDLTGAVVLALSLIGYVLFFSLRFRLRTSLILTGLSLGAMLAVFALLVP